VPRHREFMMFQKVTVGPLCRYVDDAVLVMKTWWNQADRRLQQEDTQVPFLPFDDTIYKSSKTLRIGYYTDDELFPTSKPVRRAILEAVDGLRKRGHEVVEFKPKHTKELFFRYIGEFAADGLNDFFGALQGEQRHKIYTLLYVIHMLPRAAMKTLTALLRAKGEQRKAEIAESMYHMSVTQLWDVQADQFKWRKEFLRDVVSQRFDAWLSPTTATPAFKHGTSAGLTSSISAFLQNILEVPAGSVPYTVVRADEEEYQDEFNDEFTKNAKNLCQGSAGLPIGVQVSALPFHDEQVLRVMKEIEEEAKFHQQHQPKILTQIK
jgi:fatty acid amide hydrolase